MQWVVRFLTVGLFVFANNQAVKAAIIYDFENLAPTALPQDGALSSLSISKSGVTLDIRRPGARFDIVSNTAFHSKPSRFGRRSLDPFFDTSAKPFIMNFSTFVTRVSLTAGDYGQDTPDQVQITGYSRPNATGELVAFADASIPTLSSSNPFNHKTLNISYPGIRSIEVIGGTPRFPNSVFYDNIAIVKSPLGPIELSKGLEFVRWGAENTVTMAGSVAASAVLCGTFPLSCKPLAVLHWASIFKESIEFQRILNDPPDPSYTSVFAPKSYTPPDITESPLVSTSFEVAGSKAIALQFELNSFVEAWRITLERYNAAIAAGDVAAADMQQQALEAYILQTSRIGSLLSGAIVDFAAEFPTEFRDLTITPLDLQQFQSNLAANGFSSLQLEVLNALDLSNSEIAELRDFLLNLSSEGVSGTVVNNLTELAERHADGSEYTQCVGDTCRAYDEVVSTPAVPFFLTFEYGFGSETGILEVLLNDKLLATFDNADGQLGEFLSFRSLIQNPALLGLEDVQLSFLSQNPSESQILVRNVNLLKVPEPPSIAVFAISVSFLVLVIRNQRRTRCRRG